MRRINWLLTMAIGILVIFQGLAFSFVFADTNSCISTDTSNCVNISPLPTTSTGSNTVGTLLNLTFIILGSVAVLIMVLAGFRYITSSGKPEELAKAKDTIIYAAVGIIICVFAVTIVSFVAGLIK